MAVIYAFYGIDPTSEPLYQTQPNWHNGPTVWEPLYQKIIGELEVRFASQITQSLANYGANSQYLINSPYLALAGLYFDPTTDRFEGNLKNVLSMAIAMAPSEPDLASAYWNKLIPMIAELRLDIGSTNGLDIGSQELLSDGVQASAIPSFRGSVMGSRYGSTI